MITVRVPATSANLGPGFDCLGIAFKLYSFFSFKEIPKGLVITGCDEEYQNEKNLVYTSFRKTMDYLNFNVSGIEINIKSDIPVSRGLGSSAACIIGGVMGANAIAGNPLSKEEIFKICNEIEGHPDNIAPGIYGGFTASMVEEGVPYTVSYDISQKLYFCALIPDFMLSTSEARAVLPEKVPRSDAVYNVSRVAVLLKGLEMGDKTIISKSLSDKLHEKYRSPLIKEYEEVKKICREHGNTAMFISGAGPTIMNITDDANFGKRIEEQIKKLKSNWAMKLLETDTAGAVVF